MKRILFVLAALLISAATVSAQDIITKKTGEDIKAKVLEVDTSNIKYKLFDEPEGVTYTISKSQILMVRYESGRNEVFNTAPVNKFANEYGYGLRYREPAEGIEPGMKYKDLKKLYDLRDYYPSKEYKHSPALMGVSSFFIPGLGQMISGELGRGFGWFGGFLGAGACFAVAGLIDMKAGMNETLVNVIGVTGVLGIIVIDIWSAVDASRVAKVRNMYEEDLQRKGLTFELHPSVNYIMMADKVQPTTGLTLTMKF